MTRFPAHVVNSRKSDTLAPLTVDLSAAIFDAVMDALEAYQMMSKRAMDSANAHAAFYWIVLCPAQLCGAILGTTTVPEVIG